ncbi:receptor-like protein 39 [Apium graveolens]|uniref:receptor-like protein 39 n=1 Tax=Apium graveolens TaxID=4045 RepID=UPI003D7BA37C
MKNIFSYLLLLMPFFQILLVYDITSVSGQCLDNQRSLLLHLVEGLAFDASVSRKLVTWKQSTEDCCKWEGVICNISSGHVIGLELDGESINAGINSSSSLYKFQYLQRLNLANNNFNATEIPSGLFNLTSLTYLNLSNCGFSGQISEGLSRMTRLNILDLSTVYVSGKSSLKVENPNLEVIVQNLKELTQLYLDGVNLTTQANNWSLVISSSLPNLRVLSLSNSHISGPIDPSIERLRHLSHLRLDQNNLNATVPEFLANLTSLKVLQLSSCNLNGMFPKRILEIPTLDVLDLSDNKRLQGSLPEELPENGSLQTLVLRFTNFSGMLPQSIGNLASLSRIEISNCNFSGRIPDSISNLKRLVRLEFSYNNLSGPIPSLKNSTNLTYLDLSNNRLSGTIASRYFQANLNLVTVDLGFNVFSGGIPSSLFALQSLQKFTLSQNQFSGLLPNFTNATWSQLDTLDLSGNNLSGSIPNSFFELKWLKILSLSANRLSGSLQLKTVQRLENLTYLDLSYNNLFIKTFHNSSEEALLPKFSTLRLASCKLKSFPNLENQSRLNVLDLSDNQISGVIPSWIWNLGNRTLMYLNLSQNQLVSIEEPFAIAKLSVLDLHSNKLTGRIPVPPKTAAYVDYSANSFSSSISPDFAKNLALAYFFSVSNNKLTGSIPDTICEALYLQVLDLSSNRLSGPAPSCLFGQGESLVVLNLGNNNLSGHINGSFLENSGLKTLDLHANNIEGSIPRSLSNWTNLEVLNMGNNHINDTFPCFLKNSSTLRVLVLRFNHFHGDIRCVNPKNSWPNLQIIDIASNNFTGKVPPNSFLNWKAMLGNKDSSQGEIDHLRYKVLKFNNFYYQDTVTVTYKGLDVELVKILTIFNSIDISCNQFEGNIPETIGRLKNLYLLNLSHNALTGSIPASLGNLKQLESLDFSVNNLSGRIPEELTSLTFLSFLNLSYNQLTGHIPVGSQFSTFEEGSYKGNDGLCGSPLRRKCSGPSLAPNEHPVDSNSSFDWPVIFIGIGFGLGAAIILGPLMFLQTGHWLDEYIDKFTDYFLQNSRKTCDRYEVPEEGLVNPVYPNHENGIAGVFRGRYCLRCSELNMLRQNVVHDPKCMCHYSTLITIIARKIITSG